MTRLSVNQLLFVADDAVSSGKGYCQPGSKVILKRYVPPSVQQEPAKKKGQQTLSFLVRAMRLCGDVRVCLTARCSPSCAFMQKKPSARPLAKNIAKPNNIVRFTNEGGFGSLLRLSGVVAMADCLTALALHM